MPRQKPIDWSGEKKVNLALQGGGAHGAFTWGVLDAILEDGRLDIEAISGTSAGAMNAVVFAQGYLENGRAGARKRLAEFWEAISNQGSFSPIQRQALDAITKPWGMQESPAYWWLDFVTHYASPYEFNPLDINPLRDLLEKMIDFKKVRACKQLELFVAATNVQTGKVAVFKRDELTADHVMASACLPFLFRAVEIGGASYWDGGYMGNPALFPLIYETGCQDMIIVQINPIERSGTPRTAREIQDRVNEITFNGMMLRELRAIEFVQRLIDEGKLAPPEYMKAFVHRIDGAEPLKAYSAASKLDASWESVQQMRDIGRTAAHEWLVAHYNDVGQRNTLDLRAAFA